MKLLTVLVLFCCVPCVYTCVPGYNYSATGVGPCTPCNPCIPGYTQTAPCTATTDTSCMCVGCASDKTVLIGMSWGDYLLYKTTDLGTGASVVVPPMYKNHATATWFYYTQISASPLGNFLLLNDFWAQYLLDFNTGQFTTVFNSQTVRGACMSPDGTFALVLDGYLLYQVDLVSFQQTLLAGGQTGDGIGTNAGILGNAYAIEDIRIANSQTFAVFTVANCIRTYTFATQAVLTIAGSCDVTGYVNGAGVAARFSQTRGLDVSQDGSYALVSDYTNNKIRKVMILTGITTTVASLTTHPMAIHFSYDYKLAYISSEKGLHVITVSTSNITTIGWAGVNPQYERMTFFTPPTLCVAGVTYSSNGYALCSQCSSCAHRSIESACTTTSDSVCGVCPSNFYCPNRVVATECPGISISPEGSSSFLNCSCPGGTYGIVTAQKATCSQCPNNSYCTGEPCQC